MVSRGRRRRTRHLTPTQSVVVGFLAAIAIGTVLLMLPIAHEPGAEVDVLVAAFTAVSAVCVTGLVVVDTGTAYSAFGETVILVLIQVGGLGIMLVASLIGLVIARRFPLRNRLTAVAENRALTIGDTGRLAKGILLVALSIEAILAVVLAARFAWGYGFTPADALWNGVFHAVSSFNNAGFGLFSDSMLSYATDPIITLPICAAVILGGVGYPVLVQLRRELRRPLHWSMNTNLVITMTIVLLIGGTAWVAAHEWNNPNTLGAFSAPDRLLVAFFQSVQTRTAGFNSVDIGAMDPETWLGMNVLMFIGGGPAGTAGGIKVTTFAVLLFIIIAELRGDPSVTIFGKRLSRAVHRQAITIVLLGVGAVLAATAALADISDESLDELLFEATSAFATVGLSTGITADLPPAGQVILMLLMFVGRLGPLTLGTALVLRERRAYYELPKERPAIG